MRFGSSIIAGIATATTAAAASERVVKLDLTARLWSNQNELRPWLRDVHDGSRFEQEIDYNTKERAYYANVVIGDPPETVSLLVDTGSADTWVLDRAAICDKQGGCNSTYNPEDSSSFTLVEEGAFNVSYVSNDTAKGDWIRETLGIGDDNAIVLKDLQIGLAKSSQLNTGILAVGYPPTSQPGDPPPFIDKLKSDGHISARAYSLYLDDISSAAGSILFGGIDKTKFTGPLWIVDEVPNRNIDIHEHFRVNLTAIAANQSTVGGEVVPLSSGNSSVRVLLDSGTAITRLPYNIVTHMLSQFKARDDRNNSGVGLIDCATVDQLKGTTIDFTFGRPGDTNPAAIQVPISEFVIDNIDNATLAELPQDLGFSRVCWFGLLDTDGTYSIIGQNVLRSAYVVFDLDHSKVGLAQANVESGSSSSSDGDGGIIEITEEDGIPDGLIGQPSQGGTPTVSGGTSGNPSALANPTSTGQSGGGVSPLRNGRISFPKLVAITIAVSAWSS